MGKYMDFLKICNKIGVDSNVREYCGNLFLLKKDDTVILFDNEYNIIDFEKRKLSKEEICNKYKIFTEKLNDEKCFPFNNVSIKQIIDISSDIELNHNHDLISENYNYEPYNIYLQLLCYILFLGDEIKKYQQYSYHMNRVGLDIPNVIDYTKALINKINVYIDNVDTNKEINPMYLLRYLGKNLKDYELTRNLLSLLRYNHLNNFGNDYLLTKVDELLEFINDLDNPLSKNNESKQYKKVLKLYINQK